MSLEVYYDFVAISKSYSKNKDYKEIHEAMINKFIDQYKITSKYPLSKKRKAEMAYNITLEIFKQKYDKRNLCDFLLDEYNFLIKTGMHKKDAIREVKLKNEMHIRKVILNFLEKSQ